jgi:hypothetical protein
VKLKINKIFLGRSIGEVASGTLAEIAKIIRESTGERLIDSFVELDGDVVPARVFIEDLRRRYREKQRLEMADVTREVSEKKVPLDSFTVSSRESKIAVPLREHIRSCHSFYPGGSLRYSMNHL